MLDRCPPQPGPCPPPLAPWLRNGHGNGAGQPRIEVPPADELPQGVPAPMPVPMPAATRGEHGRLVPGAGTSEQARRASQARWAKQRSTVRALDRLGLRGIAPEAIQPYLADAEEFAQHEIDRLARSVGGGECGAGPASMVQSSALQTAASRYLYALGFAENDADKLGAASRLADSARQNLLAAHALAAKEAKARPRDALADLDRRLGIEDTTP